MQEIRLVKSNFKLIIKQIFLTFLILFPLGLYFGLSYLVLTNDPNEHQPWISWFDNPSSEVYVSWETKKESKGVVQFTNMKNLETQSIIELETSNIHHVNLSGLDADTLYHYNITIDGELFGSGQFKTAPLVETEFTWVMTSDTQQPKVTQGHQYKIANIISNSDRNYLFYAIVGDLVDEGRKKSDWNNFFRTANAYSDTIPIIPVMGNHDRVGSGGFFTDYFINSVENNNNQFYYSFNWSNVHFTMCNFPYGGNSDFNNEQLEWIEEDLQNSNNITFKIVMFHAPVVGAGFYGRNENLITRLLPILAENNVTAIINGHEHHYERGLINNEINPDNPITYFILGSGGGAFDPGLRPQPETRFMTLSPCYTEVHATSNQLDFKTLSLEGKVIDTFIINTEVNF